MLEFLNAPTPQIMGVINVAPDSYSPIGKCLSAQKLREQVTRYIRYGCNFIDIGAEPTNPQTHPVTSSEQEFDRLMPALDILKNEFDIPISVDTSKPEVMQAVIEAGADMINDVRALRLPGAIEVVAQFKIPVCLMHMCYPSGLPKQPVLDPYDGDVVGAVKTFLIERAQVAMDAGIKREHIILDPGFGGGSFGKNAKQNLMLLKNLNVFTALGFPICAGLSRKSLLQELLQLPVEERLPGSLVLACLAAMGGAHIIRTHDVKETMEAVSILTYYQES